MQTQEFRIPHHGSYIYDIRFIEGDGGLEHMMTIRDDESAELLENRRSLDIILPLVRRAYPEVSSYDMSHYGNKNFTAIGSRNFGQKIVVLYRHDFSWAIMTIPKDIFVQYQRKNPYYSPVQWDDLPAY